MTSIRFMIVLNTVQFNLGFTIDEIAITNSDKLLNKIKIKVWGYATIVIF